MGFLSIYDGTVVIDALTGAVVPENADRPEWWVEIQKTLAQGDYESAQRFLVGEMGMEAKASAPEDGVFKQRSDIIGYQRQLVLAALVDWNLTDHDDQRLQIANFEDRKRSVSKLPPAAFNAIYQKVAELNKPRDVEDEAQFPASDAASSENGGQGASEPVDVLDGSSALEAARA